MFGLFYWKLWLGGAVAIGVLLFAIWSLNKAVLTSLDTCVTQRTELRKTVEMAKYREISLRRQLDRYKAAVGALPAATKNKINHWVKNPDDIPRPFDPSQQLTAPNLRTDRLDGLDTRPVYPDDWKWTPPSWLPSWLGGK